MIGVEVHPPQIPGHLQPVAIRQAEVEQDDVGVPSRRLGEPVLRRLGLDQPVVQRAERGTEEAPHLRLVLDQQDQRRRVHR